MAVSPTTQLITITFTFLLITTLADGLGSAATLAAVYGSRAVCGIVVGEAHQRVRCYRSNSRETVAVLPNISFQEISGGRSFFCGLRRGGRSLLCWDDDGERFQPKRIYHSDTIGLTGLTVGDDQVCAMEVGTGVAQCWRGSGEWSLIRGNGNDYGGDASLFSPLRFSKITCGSGFVCGILRNNSRVLCWGSNRNIGVQIQTGFGNLSMSSLVAGECHACGLTTSGALICKGNNNSGQLNVKPSANFKFSGFALGANFTCAITRLNGLVTCWGDYHGYNSHGVIGNVSFESIVAGSDFICGLTTSHLSVICWGPGWSGSKWRSYDLLPIGMVIPGPCVRSSCGLCGVYLDSEILCRGSGSICKSCQTQIPFAASLPPRMSSLPVSQSAKDTKKLLLGFLILGSVGCLIGFSTLVYCLWARISHRQFSDTTARSHSIAGYDNLNAAVKSELSVTSTNNQSSISSEAFHQTLGRRKSGSTKPEIFSLPELAVSTGEFSAGNRIGSGSFGAVYRGRLSDGREVAVKRGYTRTKRSFEEKEAAFGSEVGLLSRLHHKHLVSLLGFCDESDERLLVYEYMPNGSLHHRLHGNDSVGLSSWKERVRIALEAARGVEYLHNYAVPPIIHRDIKSSNILLDADMTAKVADFGLSLVAPPGEEAGAARMAAGTMGYIDPEYYVLNVLTTKSDVYGLGVVMLELLTGKRAVFRSRSETCDGGVTSVVEYAAKGLLLDERVGGGDGGGGGGVEVLAATAMRCVRSEGERRPCVAEVVACLETAFALCCQ